MSSLLSRLYAGRTSRVSPQKAGQGDAQPAANAPFGGRPPLMTRAFGLRPATCRIRENATRSTFATAERRNYLVHSKRDENRSFPEEETTWPSIYIQILRANEL